ncbi:ABC transporter ATP-binding protein [Erythrobacter sp.]|jgi:ATP-binding cassette subfamily B protein/subfamily B ATP-binding cassette protein MsbA|uniref:ABC transporter ATP-binding protein n=1 Tax=Erythrobacter sp. TaxID=1042 RepID=UPI002EA908C5|nr:ABC transporter ATP-binding protein [Erythrobacter sp.]
MSSSFWLGWARRFAPQLALISLLAILASAATLAVPWLGAQLIAGLLTPGEVDRQLALVLALLVAVLVVLTALTIAAAYLSEKASLQILTELRMRIYDHVQTMQLAFHDDHRAGDVLALTSYEVGNLSDFLANTIANAPALLLTAAGAVAILFWLDPVMALIVPVLIPFFYLLAKLAGRRLRTMSAKVRAADVELIAIAERDLEILPAIKAFAVEAEHSEAFAEAAGRAREAGVKLARLKSFIGPVMTLAAALAAIGVLLLVSGGSGSVGEGGERSAGELFAFLLYAALLTRPIGALAGMYGTYQMARGTLARLESVLALDPEPGYAQGGAMPRVEGAIAFENVHFAYPGRPPLFTGFDLTIAQGETVALTGENGVGKSTLIRLLLRFSEPQGGRITLDGTDIARPQVQALRRQIGYVPQRALLFDGTVAENIRFAQPLGDAEAAIERAVRLAGAERFIAQLPDGLETRIGDHGVRLSGGQRQRIALARALLRDPPIIVLDEATAMYDLESEARFVENCLEAVASRTTIIISHRPASLTLADRIVRIGEGGTIAEIEVAD